MAQDTKNWVNDGFEIYWMKQILGRESKTVSWMDWAVGGYFLLANIMGDATYFSVTKDRTEEHRAIWQAFLGGNVSPMRQYVENREFSEKLSNGFEDALFGC
jgi:hypothetical protein